ncbi:MAG: hypothetical protein SOX46_03275 [Clostridiaceae bacterium]|uniref:Uncharacterized protein n=1 Tax=Clostridium porci TaxID=2605778 RepID=A0A7X2NKN1_9CLOT|nr:hypothetical protein [Clostridium porci]MDY3230587.1 hypothetical protein [Clostridiaceae bacterium]MSS36615.1 hypothetical protein [Clostridium porci]
MSNLEQAMKAAAAALTGQEVNEIPDNLESICSFIAQNYKAQSAALFKQVEAPADALAAPTKEEFNGLIAKLKEAKIFK